ncbi:MAG TPA: permease-like cell division protein FtsX [Chitinophagaceae bacterium]|nr:permease-like cell division protein FtsX [Chitinophagaceae bacterium]
MSQFGKGSAKRGKPSYIYAIIGVALVLFLFGIVGWIFLNIRKTGEYFKESIQGHVYLYRSANTKQIDSVKRSIDTLPYILKAEYISREQAIEKYNTDNDTLWKKLAIENPLPASIDFNVKAAYMEKDSMANLESYLLNSFPNIVSEIRTPTETIVKVSKFVKTSAIILAVLTVILSILVIISIDNTIRLAMYSNRFLIKTMQMVGATRNFIAKPLNIKAIINGLIAAGVAIGLLFIFIGIAERVEPSLNVLHDNGSLILLSLLMIILGLVISLFSTHRSVLKYLKMKLDDLY